MTSFSGFPAVTLSRHIRQLFESYGFLIQGWESIQTDWVTLRPSGLMAGKAAAADAV